MSVPGNDLLSQIENEQPKLGIYIRNYLIPTLQPKGRAGYVLSTPTDKPGTTALRPISSLSATANPKSAAYVGTSSEGTIVTAPDPGTVTSVDLSMPTEFSVAGGPVTGSGTLAVTKANQAANKVYAGPATGPDAGPIFRFLVASDLPAGTTPSFADNEILGGVGTAWTFANAPISNLPTSTSVHLYVQQYISGPFVRLPKSAIVSITGNAMVTAASWTTGALMADYRY